MVRQGLPLLFIVSVDASETTRRKAKKDSAIILDLFPILNEIYRPSDRQRVTEATPSRFLSCCYVDEESQHVPRTIGLESASQANTGSNRFSAPGGGLVGEP